MSKVALCTDSVSVQYPECLGLKGESLYSQEWLQVFSGLGDMRARVRAAQPDEVWVAGSDEVDAINLAAALKMDDVPRKVCLIAFEGSGSLFSRARAARIDEVWDRQTFLQHYHREKEAGEVVGRHALPAAKPQVENTADASDAHVIAFEPVQDERKHARTASGARGHLISVVGAGGGVGKSSVAVVAAYLAQSQGFRTVLVDGDLQFGDIHYLTGREDAIPLDEVVTSPKRLESLDCDGRQPAVLAAPKRLEQSEVVVGKMPELVDALLDRFDVVVVNTSPAWGDMHLHLIETGGSVLFLLDQRPSSIRACKHALQLCARCGVATQSIVFALNRCSRQSLFSSIDITCALQGARVVEFAEGGRDVEEMLGTGAPIELLDSGNALCQSVSRVLADLLPAQQPGQSRSFAMPSRKRFKFSSKRKKAACL